MILDFLPSAWRPYTKAVVAALTPVLGLAVLGLLGGGWDTPALSGASVGAIGAIGVIVTTAIPTLRALVGALVILLGLVVTGLLSDAWDTTALAGAIIAVVSALFVYGAPNEKAGRSLNDLHVD